MCSFVAVQEIKVMLFKDNFLVKGALTPVQCFNLSGGDGLVAARHLGASCPQAAPAVVYDTSRHVRLSANYLYAQGTY